MAQVGSSPVVKTTTNSNRQVLPGEVSHPKLVLGPWEHSITGDLVSQQMTKLVADFFFLNVVQRDDLGELASRGVEIEIEAKLGQLIDQDTNVRYFLPVRSECILAENSRLRFESSMTEVRGVF